MLPLGVVTCLMCLVVVHGLGEVRIVDEVQLEGMVGKGQHVLVEFYEPECGHCSTMEPDFYATAGALEYEEDVILVRVDTKQSPKIKKALKIEGHPVFKWYPAKKDLAEPENFYFVHYSGRMANTFLRMIGERTGKTYPELDQEASLVKEGDADDFKENVLKSAVPVFCTFVTPWTESRDTADTLTKLAKLGAGSTPQVSVAKLNIQRSFERDIADAHNCRIYPCFFLFQNGAITHTYTGQSDNLIELLDFINLHLDLSLDPAALDPRLMLGRIPEIDAKLKKTPPTQWSELIALQEGSTDAVQYYAKTAAKLLISDSTTTEDSSAVSYLDSELSRITSLANKPGISITKRKDLFMRKNILAAFLTALKTQERQLKLKKKLASSPRDDL